MSDEFTLKTRLEIILTSNSNVYFAMSTDVGDALLESEKGIL